eukprot:UN16763
MMHCQDFFGFQMAIIETELQFFSDNWMRFVVQMCLIIYSYIRKAFRIIIIIIIIKGQSYVLHAPGRPDFLPTGAPQDAPVSG